ncbi:2-oxo acid dehydrogenase subunit E2 [Geomonas sp. Red69]|uniref:Dihydrolipoamide acetyltransferase component of pyruvate dehydrogenase complex n=1 Tax=Geomonas diazotrophica TaxID=2843197 RepID=A0ABX8JS75_9BACT|nr:MULTISPECIES: dihydrolipoamide acetyltransferase family protein [Geomonas]MBU5637164.1 2-oxo acid dehydrogenase subunit E2 [Geomonas diazotrophica]QWV99459.1 2-oxo acid dehydrogenase subunit E2 [Geomonas nitrogeniifigens]QXE88634.1 2-oxo acid dehydrogenase subunit E2 [Geomonas nitrogeniifigens]
MNEIVMPKLSDTMTEGRLVQWKKRVGDEVRRGEVIAEVETDKANMELEAFAPGVLLEIRVQSGEMVQVGTVIAIVGKAGEKVGGAPAEPEAPLKEAPPEAGAPEAGVAEAGAEPQSQAEREAPETVQGEGGKAPREATSGGEQGGAEPTAEPAEAKDLSLGEGERQAPAAPPLPGEDKTQPAGEPPGTPRHYIDTRAPAPGGAAQEAVSPGRERAAPVVRRRARELGIDLAEVRGSGPEGRILLQDLEGEGGKPAATGVSAQPAQPKAQAAPAEAPSPGPKLVQEVKAMSKLRAAVAKTVAESWAHIPHFTVTMDIAMDEAESIRRQLKQGGMHVTVNDIIVKGVALALVKFPQMNASFGQDGLQFHGEVNVSVAVGVPEGVLMPVIHGCDSLSLPAIAQEADRLVQRARSGALTGQEMSGGTFSVSNLGMFQVSSFTAVIPPSQAGVLAVGAVVDVPVLRSGVLANAKVMKVTLSADHRVVDGAYAAQFLVELRDVLENPVRLLM